MRVGVIFGCGSSVDQLPDKFFRWAERQTVTFGMNGSPLSVRMKEANFIPDCYCAWDTYDPVSCPVNAEILEELKDWSAQGTILYLGGVWPIPSVKPSMKPVKFTAEWAVHIAAADYKCDEIVLVGTEGHGPHHLMTNGWTHPLWIEGPPKVGIKGLRQIHRLAFKYAKNMHPGVRFSTWPATSVLYPKPIENLFDMENDAGWCNSNISDLSSEAHGATPCPATKSQESMPGADLSSRGPSDTAARQQVTQNVTAGYCSS